MIITKTPFRISFAGGGTDLKAFYSREYGAVVSTAIDKYMYIAMHRFFERKIMLKYSKTETVDKVDDIQHPLIRESMKIAKVDDPVEITSFADIPSKGSGLGSSSSFTAGLVKALYAYKGKHVSQEELAQLACTVEIDRLREPIGKQDQYATAYGGFNYIRFNPDDTVEVDPIILSREQRQIIQDSLVMFYTGMTRKASDILSEQMRNTSSEAEKFRNLQKMRDLADELSDRLARGEIKAIGDILHKGWTLKRELAEGVTNDRIDAYYRKARDAGATGGKILGAGGGGFLLFWCPRQKQDALKDALSDLKHVPFGMEGQGSRVIYYGE